MDHDVFKKFLEIPSKRKLIFGFTYDIWEKLYLSNLKFKKINLSNTTLIHGGGWKKLENKNISKNYFNNFAKKTLGVKRTINYCKKNEEVKIYCNK